MRTTIAEGLHPRSAPSSPLSRPIAFARGGLIVGGLVIFWTLLLVANLVALPIRLVRRVLRR